MQDAPGESWVVSREMRSCDCVCVCVCVCVCECLLACLGVSFVFISSYTDIHVKSAVWKREKEREREKKRVRRREGMGLVLGSHYFTSQFRQIMCVRVVDQVCVRAAVRPPQLIFMCVCHSGQEKMVVFVCVFIMHT